jgi:hypothetical protein
MTEVTEARDGGVKKREAMGRVRQTIDRSRSSTGGRSEEKSHVKSQQKIK